MKNFNEITAQSTTRSGELKRTVWTTKLHSDVLEGRVDVKINNSETVTINERTIPVLPLVGMALHFAYDDKYSLSVNDVLNYAEKECLTQLQVDYSGVKSKGIAKDKPAQSKGILSAQQYKENCISQIVHSEHIGTVTGLLDRVNEVNSKTTKEELITLLADFSTLFFTDAQEKQYTDLCLIEEQTKEYTQALQNIGFDDIVRVGDSSFRACIAITDSQNAILELTQAGFTIDSIETDNLKLVVHVSAQTATNPLV